MGSVHFSPAHLARSGVPPAPQQLPWFPPVGILQPRHMAGLFVWEACISAQPVPQCLACRQPRSNAPGSLRLASFSPVAWRGFLYGKRAFQPSPFSKVWRATSPAATPLVPSGWHPSAPSHGGAFCMVSLHFSPADAAMCGVPPAPQQRPWFPPVGILQPHHMAGLFVWKACISAQPMPQYVACRQPRSNAPGSLRLASFSPIAWRGFLYGKTAFQPSPCSKVWRAASLALTGSVATDHSRRPGAQPISAGTDSVAWSVSAVSQRQLLF
jgi:hypothetical protein